VLGALLAWILDNLTGRFELLQRDFGLIWEHQNVPILVTHRLGPINYLPVQQRKEVGKYKSKSSIPMKGDARSVYYSKFVSKEIIFYPRFRKV
jgi:hypothetical protein